MTDTTAIIRDLARARAAIQMHTIAAVIDQRPMKETMMSERTYTAAEATALVRAALEAAATAKTPSGFDLVSPVAQASIRALDPAAIVAAHKGDTDDR